MRKHLVLALLLMATVSMTAQETVDSLGIHPYKPTEFLANGKSNWSLWLTGGFPFTDFDFGGQQKSPICFNSNGTLEIPSFTLGLAGEYNWNNTFGIGLQYKFHNVQVEGKNDDVKDLFNGRFHQATAFISADIFNAWRKTQSKKIFSLNLMAGAGAAWYKCTQYYHQKAHISSTDGTLQYGQVTASDKVEPGDGEKAVDKFNFVPVITLGATFEFNVCRSISLGVGAWYNFFTNDQIEGRISGSNNDGIWDLDLVLRYKIDAVKKSHMRDYVGEETFDEQYAKSHPGYKKGKGGQGGEGGNGDGNRDTVVVFHRDTIVMVGENKASNYSDEDHIKETLYRLGYHYVYFDNAQAVINDQGLIIIQQVASRLEREPEKCAILIGYCDNTGSIDFNDKLSAQRAMNVYDELQQEHLVDTARMVCFSRGILYGHRSKNAYAPNRRVEILIVDKDEFERLKKENKDNISSRSTISTREERRKTSAENTSVQTVKVSENVTLSKLAREYYENTHCWVYIYQANQDRINDPSRLPSGLELIIPELTEEQKQITKEQAHDLYLTLRDQD